ncbi:hypothetical protein ZIOFF_074344 (mitochondrion) [Zingiber officinale]|uniref:Uncharacterized protein n=1 Tax=Zingiber officinale TaxID=94328 RepID=A0A8J5BUR0_ZINOF|nr:hypothetical protein ZIOFF_074344 [Zingiber officinale]
MCMDLEMLAAGQDGAPGWGLSFEVSRTPNVNTKYKSLFTCSEIQAFGYLVVGNRLLSRSSACQGALWRPAISDYWTTPHVCLPDPVATEIILSYMNGIHSDELVWEPAKMSSDQAYLKLLEFTLETGATPTYSTVVGTTVEESSGAGEVASGGEVRAKGDSVGDAKVLPGPSSAKVLPGTSYAKKVVPKVVEASVVSSAVEASVVSSSVDASVVPKVEASVEAKVVPKVSSAVEASVVPKGESSWAPKVEESAP